jgi:hypothetical protein
MSFGAQQRFTYRPTQREAARRLIAPVRPAARPESNALRSRRDFEYRLGHFLARHPTSIRVSQEMCCACLQLLRARARALARSPSGRKQAFFASLKQVLRPVALPFAGRVRNTRELFNALNGEGNVRELQGVVWLVFAHLLMEDAAGPKALPALLDILGDASLNPDVMRQWIASAVEHRARVHGPTTPADLNPHEELFRMPWHAARRAQNETRVYFSDFHLKWRYWTLVSRREFASEGGTFSRIERELQSVMGPHMCPWLDVRRFTRPNETSPLVQLARANDIPLENGVSGVGVQSLQFARVLSVADLDAVRTATSGYLMSIKAHSLYELVYAMQADESLPIIPLKYETSLNIDWGEVARHCGSVPNMSAHTARPIDNLRIWNRAPRGER